MIADRTPDILRGAWMPGSGAAVEIRRWGIPIRRGRVESVMPDGSGFWIAADGADPRIFIHRDYDDITIWS